VASWEKGVGSRVREKLGFRKRGKKREELRK